MPFGGPQYSSSGEKIFLYNHACQCGVERLGVHFFDFIDDCGFVTDSEIVEDKLANLGEFIADCVAQLDVVNSQKSRCRLVWLG